MMRYYIIFLTFFLLACNYSSKVVNHFSEVAIETLYTDSISIRAIAIYNDTLVGFGYNKGYGFLNLNTNQINRIDFDVNDHTGKIIPEQRAVCFSGIYFFSLGINSPAVLRKVNINNKKARIVYTETHDRVFYNAMTFWNEKEGIAIGDPTETCLSIIITRDGGETWRKVSCESLPAVYKGEAAFAASNGNIAIVGDKTWVVSGGIKSRVFYSEDKGKTWEVFNTPIIQGKETTGAYSVDFYDEKHGVIFGGDYTKPNQNDNNKAITSDGGTTWKALSGGAGYKSCIRYLPNTKGKGMVAIGFTGISISQDSGDTWKQLSKEGFYTLRFLNDSIAIAAGKNKIAKLMFK